MRLLLLLLCGLLLTPTAALADPHEVPTSSIDQLAWLVGIWEGEHFGEAATTTVNPRVGNTMAAAYQVVNEDGICTIIECDLIEETAEGLFWHYAIFGPGLEPLMDTPFGQRGTYRLEIVDAHKLSYMVEGEPTMLKEATMELLEDGRLKSSVVLIGQSGDQLIEFYSTRRD